MVRHPGVNTGNVSRARHEAPLRRVVGALQNRDRQVKNLAVAVPTQQCTAPPTRKDRATGRGALLCVRDTSIHR
jgi:hypothetical protein